MDCQIRRAGDVAEMVLVGSLDSSWSSYLAERIDEVLRGGALDVRVDMAGVSYLSSNGIGLLIRCQQQLRRIGGRFRIVAESEAVARVLQLTGAAWVLHDAGVAAGPSVAGAAIERDGLSLLVYPRREDGRADRLELIGDPGRLRGRGYEADDERTWRAEPGMAAIGLGALGPCFADCRDRFGEFLAVAGVAAYRPGSGAGRPDFEQAVDAFVPEARLLYGLAFPTGGVSVLRFEAKGEPGAASSPLGAIADACLEQAGGDAAGIVIAGESDGMVGAALRRSPVGLLDGLDPFAHPEVRDWLSFTPEPEFARSTAIVVGVAARRAGPPLSPFVRPIGASTEIQGHFHAAVVPYRPLPGGAVQLAETVAHLLEPGRIDAILHLLGDPRPIIGAGESVFTRGVAWYVPLTIEGGSTAS